MLARLVLVGAIALNTVNAQQPPLERARWLAGCWELRSPTRLTLEMWMPPAADMMLGGSRTVAGNSVREFEHLRIRAEAGKLVYIALPSGQRETAFPSTQISDSSLVFENLTHDFPQRVIYRRRGADSIVARIEGPGPNNTVRGIDFPMRRADCLVSSPPPPPPPDSLIYWTASRPDSNNPKNLCASFAFSAFSAVKGSYRMQ